MRKLSYTLVALGLALLLATGLLLAGNAWQNHSARKSAATLLAQVGEAAGSTPAEDTSTDTGQGDEAGSASTTEAALGAEDVYAVLEIPVLGLELPVINRYSTALLEAAPCVYRAPEGLDDDRPVLAGHNYAAHFKDIPALQAGAEVRLTPPGGAARAYAVSGVEEIDESDYAGLYAGSWDLTLFTCNFLGDRRILVRCTLVS